MAELPKSLLALDDIAALAARNGALDGILTPPKPKLRKKHRGQNGDPTDVADGGGVALTHPDVDHNLLHGKPPAGGGPSSLIEQSRVPPPSSGIVNNVVEGIDQGAGLAAAGVFALDVGAPVLAGAVGLISKAAAEKIKKPKEFVHETKLGKGTLHSGIMYGSFTAMGGVATFGVARSFFGKLESLKLMYADMTGIDIKKVSTTAIVTGDLPHCPQAVAQARDHLMKEHGGRFLAQLVGFGLNLKGLLHGGLGHGKLGTALDLASGFGPQAADMAINAVMGESPVLEIYKGYSEAYKKGQEISVQDYAEFVCRASHRFASLRRDHGKHNPITLAVAQQLHDKHISPAQILHMEERKELEKLGDALMHHQPHGPAAANSAPHFQEMVNKTAPKRTGPVVGDGKFTGALAQEHMPESLVGILPAAR